MKTRDTVCKSIYYISYITQGCARGLVNPLGWVPEGNSLNRGLRGYAPIPITFRLIINDTPAVKASAIQNAFHTPTAPKK